MAIINRRNAVVGWLTWQVAKRVMRRKASNAMPRIDFEAKRPNTSAIALFAATVGGIVFFWRRRSGDDGTVVDEASS